MVHQPIYLRGTVDDGEYLKAFDLFIFPETCKVYIFHGNCSVYKNTIIATDDEITSIIQSSKDTIDIMLRLAHPSRWNFLPWDAYKKIIDETWKLNIEKQPIDTPFAMHRIAEITFGQYEDIL